MSDIKKKKIQLPDWLQYVLVGLEVLVMVVLVIIAFISMQAANTGSGTGFIKWLVLNQVWFFIIVVLPLIILFLFNIYLLIKIINESANKEFQAMTKEELMEEARRQAREELQKELQKQKEEQK
ncbi:MAG: hypothetical protein WC968_02695 [Bacilli bacterium]